MNQCDKAWGLLYKNNRLAFSPKRDAKTVSFNPPVPTAASPDVLLSR